MFEKKVKENEKKVIEKKDQKVKGEQKEHKEKSFAVKSLLIPLVVSAIVVCFIYIVMQNNEKNAVAKTDVVYAKTSIAANELITKENVNDYFGVMTVAASSVSANTYKSIKELPAKFYTEEKFAEGQFVYDSAIEKDHAVMDKYVEGTQKTSIVVSAFDNSVSGTLRHGDIVDIYAVDPETEELTLMAEDVYIVAAYNSSGEEITEDGTAVAFTILVAPDEVEQVNRAITYDGIQLYLSE